MELYGLYVESAVLVIACVLTQCGEGLQGEGALHSTPRRSAVLHPLRSEASSQSSRSRSGRA